MFKNKFWILTYYDSLTDKCSNMWICFAALYSMFPIDVDELILSVMQEHQFQTQLKYVILFFFGKVDGIPSDTQWYSCLLYLSHIDCNVGTFKNIGALRFEHTRSSEHHWHSSDFAELMCTCHLNWVPCILQACTCLVSHLGIQKMEIVPRSVDFTIKSLFIFIVVGIWHTYPTGFILVHSMIQKWDVTLVMCKYRGRNIIFPADI